MLVLVEGPQTVPRAEFSAAVAVESLRGMHPACTPLGVDASYFLAAQDALALHASRSRLDVSMRYLRTHGALVRNSSESQGLLSFSVTIPFFADRYGRDLAIRADLDAAPMLRAIKRSHLDFDRQT